MPAVQYAGQKFALAEPLVRKAEAVDSAQRAVDMDFIGIPPTANTMRRIILFAALVLLHRCGPVPHARYSL